VGSEMCIRDRYITDFGLIDNPAGPGKSLKIGLKYSDDRKRTIQGIKRVSTPGLRVYRNATEVPRVLGGLGVAVLSTSQGLMTDREARQRNVGGEVMCFVW
jgi:small subunit ribosomal protein S8